MHFKQLTIHNIASIEDATIDFEAEPLADCEVFLITGKTGAGKSTILDAICLALYASTPRLENTMMQGGTADGDNTVKINDPRQLMRRNTSEAHVSLTFVGNNGIHYEAIWSVARAYNKVSGNLKSKNWQLKNIDQELILAKDKEIEAEIKTAIGLDFKQFCRTTMLAQGEFTRFLNSKDDEKAEILEKITGVSIYSKIGARVFAITGEKELTWREAQRLVDDVHLYTEEELDAMHKELAEIDQQYTRQKTLADVTNAKLAWIREEEALCKREAQAQTNLLRAKEKAESDEFQQKERLVHLWTDTLDVRNWQAEISQSENTQKTLLQTIDEMQRQHTENIERLKTEILKLQEVTPALIQNEHDAQIRFETTREVYNQQREQAHEWAKQMRKKLKVGDICPLCHQTISQSLPHEEELSALYAAAESAFRKAETDYQTQRNRLAHAEANLKAYETQLEQQRAAEQALQSKIAGMRDRIQEARTAQQSAQSKLDAFFDEHPEINLVQLQQMKGYSSAVINLYRSDIDKVRQNVLAQTAIIQQLKQQRDDLQERRPAMEETDTIERLKDNLSNTSQLINSLGERKGAINLLLKKDEETRQSKLTRMKEADEKKTEYQKWSRINQLIGDATGNKFRKIAQSYVLSSLIHSANHYMKSLTDRYTLKVSPGTFVISIEDAYQGYTSRAASTISGGESFLVSLSLALALSDIGQTLSVDTLFVDEGFGTLSGEPLQNAIQTLRSLHSKTGRHVGIISHVEELQERIPVQIQIHQEGKDSSSRVEVVRNA